MDTKLIRSNSLRVRKIIATILAALSFFAAGLGSCLQIRKTEFYSGNCLETTPVFRKNLNECEQLILTNGELLTCENDKDFLKTSVGKSKKEELDKKEKTVRESCEYLDSLDGLEVYVTEEYQYRYRYVSSVGLEYYFNYDGSLISADEFNELSYFCAFCPARDKQIRPEEKKQENHTEKTTGADKSSVVSEEVSEQVTEKKNMQGDSAETKPETTFTYITGPSGTIDTISRCLNYIYENCYNYRNVDYGDLYHYNYGEVTSDQLVEACQTVTGYSDYDLPWQAYLVNNLNGSVRYAVFYNTTKKVFTNCGVKWNDDAKTVKEKIGGTYIESLENGKYRSTGKKTESNGWIVLSKLFWDEDTSPYLEKAENYDYVDRAYFSPVDVSGPAEAGKLNLYSIINGCYVGYKSNILHPDQLNLIAFTVISGIIAIICSVFLFIKAGKTSGDGARVLFIDKIPFAVKLVLALGAMAACAFPVGIIHYIEYSPVKSLVLDNYYSSVGTVISLAKSLLWHTNGICAVLNSLFSLILVALVCGIIRGIRNKTIFRYSFTNCVIKLFGKIWKLFKTVFDKTIGKWHRAFREYLTSDYANGRSKTGKIIALVAVTAAMVIFDTVCIFAHPVFGFLLGIIILAYVVWIMFCFDKLAKGISQIKQGNFTVDIDKKYMPVFLKSVADNICSVRDGLSNAVNDALKQQATKTELITNVTHDLKTPLTSIITYVDLLGKTENAEEQEEYLAILGEKSQKLKKLIDDLVQASKASGGAIKLNPMPIDLCQLAMQAAGENEDELEENGIELVLKNSEKPLFVTCDPQITGRIFENLISNIRKYSMKNTRAFIEVYEDSSFGTIAFKNISSVPLDIDPNRLTERFFRADPSRTGDGSGLGLSIAEDLTKIQSGLFRIEIEGDYFKVFVSFPVVNH